MGRYSPIFGKKFPHIRLTGVRQRRPTCKSGRPALERKLFLALSKSRKNVEKSKIPEGRESPEALRGMGGEQDPLKPGTAPERNGQTGPNLEKWGWSSPGKIWQAHQLARSARSYVMDARDAFLLRRRLKLRSGGSSQCVI